jgi:hypothetical protein
MTTSPRLLTDHLSFPRGRAAADIPALARQSFPLCMSNMYKVANLGLVPPAPVHSAGSRAGAALAVLAMWPIRLAPAGCRRCTTRTT